MKRPHLGVVVLVDTGAVRPETLELLMSATPGQIIPCTADELVAIKPIPMTFFPPERPDLEDE